MKILITGGAGYIGSELISILPEDVGEIIVYDNLSRKNFNFFFGNIKCNKKAIRFVQGDILDARKLNQEMQGVDVVLHLAAKVTTPFANQHSHVFDQVNNWGTSEVVRIAEENKIKKFIYISSAAVYGTAGDKAEVNEKSQAMPETYYSISKLEGEKHVQRLMGTNIETYILRLGNVYGFSDAIRMDSVINKFMFESNFTNLVRIDGSGDQLRPFIQIDRLVKNIASIVVHESEPGVYNLVENVFSINEIVDTLREIYPSLEMIFVNQNMKMRSLNVAKYTIIEDDKPTLKDDLINFKQKFGF